MKTEGCWPALLTPLDADGEPCPAAIERLVELFVRQNLGGLYIIGSTGQWPLLRLDQRRTVAERVVQASAGRIPVMVHVGAIATDDAVALAEHAAQIGADAVSCVAPVYYPTTADMTFEHYRRIGAASRLPLYVYHLSIVNQSSLDPQDYVQRLLALPNIAGMKITDGDMYQFGLLHSYAGNQLKLFSGADEVLCHAALSGACGAIGTFYNVWGPACQAARQRFVTGDVALGYRFMLAFQRAISEIIRSKSIWTFLRAAMQRRYQIDIGRPRGPLGSMDKPWADADVDRLLASVDQAAL
ncbi:MAG: dihydrodipicolinate synthase family protein [Pirellulales bacterium]